MESKEAAFVVFEQIEKMSVEGRLDRIERLLLDVKATCEGCANYARESVEREESARRKSAEREEDARQRGACPRCGMRNRVTRGTSVYCGACGCTLIGVE